MTRNFLHFDSPTPSTHVISRGDDTGTPLAFTVGDLDGPFDLTGATIDFFFRTPADTFHKSDIFPVTDQVKNKGRASGFWKLQELSSVAPGNYPCQARITFPTGKMRWCPDRPLNTIVLSDNLAMPIAVPVA